MSILVTGGAGFIGGNFVLDWFKENNESIINIDALTYAGNPDTLVSLIQNKKHFFVHGNITDSELVDSLFTKYNPRAVINFAAESHVDRSIHGPDEFIKTNIIGTFRLLESARKYWSTLSSNKQKEFRFIHISTDEVYGSLSSDAAPFKETHQYQPNSPYSASKASSDHLVRAWFHTYGLPTITTNCSNNYGPFHFPEKLIPLVILNALSNKPLPIYGDGQQIRDWLYVKDHCDAIRKVLDTGRVGETYNIGGWNEKTNLKVVETICNTLDTLRPRPCCQSYTDLITFIKDRPGHDKRYAIDARKITSQLNWKPKESFESGIQKTILWYLDNEAWVRKISDGSYQEWTKKHYGN